MITYDPVDSHRVADVVRVIRDLFNKYGEDEVYTGLIVSALISQNPNITSEHLQESVTAVTEFIALQVGTVGGTIN